MTTIQDINDIANDIVVNRIVAKQNQQKIDDIIASNLELQALQGLVDSAKIQRDELQAKLLDSMAKNNLKSWKTSAANFARASRVTASINPAHKKNIEDRLKSGEKIEGWELKETTFISVRLTKKK